jgi:hypothetical protein
MDTLCGGAHLNSATPKPVTFAYISVPDPGIRPPSAKQQTSSHVSTFRRMLSLLMGRTSTFPPLNMRLFNLSILALTLVLPLVSASLYPKNSMVKMVDTRGFRNALKENVCDITYSNHV